MFFGRGKSGVRQLLNYDPESDRRLIDQIIATFAASGGYSEATDAAPIFVTGMPRSGTTVVDRIISHHSEVTSIGESQFFSGILKNGFASRSRHIIDTAVLAGLRDLEDYTPFGQAYLDHGNQRLQGRSRFLDKFHLNILLAGFIARAMPRAKIVCLIRNPLDTILSNYRQLFEFTTPIYNYSLDLVDAAKFYVQFRRLVEFWQTTIPDQFQPVYYEQMVSAPEIEAPKLLKFCELAWEPQCIRIEDNTSSVSTASAVQVRRPINSESVGRWQRYERHLVDARKVLDDAGFIV